MGRMLTAILHSLQSKCMIREMFYLPVPVCRASDKFCLSKNRSSSCQHEATICSSSFRHSKMHLLSGMTYQQYAFCCTEAEASVMKRTRRTAKDHESNDEHSKAMSHGLGSKRPKPESIEELKLSLKNYKKYSYVFERNIAEKLVATIVKNRTHAEGPMLEIEAGPGVMSKEFLKQGISKVVALEMNENFSHFLTAVQEKVGADRLEIVHWQMVNMYLKLHSSQQNKHVRAYQKMEFHVAESLISSSRYADVPYSVFCVGGKEENENLLFFIVRNLPHEDAILSKGRVEFFLLIHPRFKSKVDYLASIKKKADGQNTFSIRERSQAVRFHYVHAMVYLFYEFDVIGQFDANGFYPPFNPVKAVQDKYDDPTKRLLVRLQLKKNIKEILPLEHHTLFLNFLRQVYKKKLARIIPTMEMLIPGCGLRLIAAGFTMLDNIVTAQPEDLLRIYKMMQEWPEYKSSPLHSYMMVATTGSDEEEELATADGGEREN